MPTQKLTLKNRVVYHKDGSVWAKGKMSGDMMAGYWEWFRKDGTKMRSGHFENGEQRGEWITYDKTGAGYKITQMKPKKEVNRRAKKHLMKTLLPLIALLGLLVTGNAFAQPEWQTLFNRKDLTGWRANNPAAAWSVVDRTLRGHATNTEMSHLFFVSDQPEGKFVTFTNFVLELSARSETNSNSGVFFHTDLQTMGRDLRLRNGYEVQLNSTAKEKRKTGSLYAVVDLAESPVNEAQWFRLRLTVQGQHITVELNDKVVVDYTEPKDVPRPPERAGRKLNPLGGGIALQAHDPGSTFYFKDIRLKRLP